MRWQYLFLQIYQLFSGPHYLCGNAFGSIQYIPYEERVILGCINFIIYFLHCTVFFLTWRPNWSHGSLITLLSPLASLALRENETCSYFHANRLNYFGLRLSLVCLADHGHPENKVRRQGQRKHETITSSIQFVYVENNISQQNSSHEIYIFFNKNTHHLAAPAKTLLFGFMRK